jgi:hypothetical protein
MGESPCLETEIDLLPGSRVYGYRNNHIASDFVGNGHQLIVVAAYDQRPPCFHIEISFAGSSEYTLECGTIETSQFNSVPHVIGPEDIRH